MLSVAEAVAVMRRELGESPKAEHSLLVGRIMRELARRFGEDGELWETVGILHDIDLPATSADLSRHGLVAAEMLGESLPPEGLRAIAAHDHRAGLPLLSRLDRSLRGADALALLGQRIPLPELERFAEKGDGALVALQAALGPERAHLGEMVARYAEAECLTLADLVEAVRRAG